MYIWNQFQICKYLQNWNSFANVFEKDWNYILKDLI
jgi:hypothetical protein